MATIGMRPASPAATHSAEVRRARAGASRASTCSACRSRDTAVASSGSELASGRADQLAEAAPLGGGQAGHPDPSVPAPVAGARVGRIEPVDAEPGRASVRVLPGGHGARLGQAHERLQDIDLDLGRPVRRGGRERGHGGGERGHPGHDLRGVTAGQHRRSLRQPEAVGQAAEGEDHLVAAVPAAIRSARVEPPDGQQRRRPGGRRGDQLASQGDRALVLAGDDQVGAGQVGAGRGRPALLAGIEPLRVSAAGRGEAGRLGVPVRPGRHDRRSELREQPAAVAGGDAAGKLQDAQVRQRRGGRGSFHKPTICRSRGSSRCYRAVSGIGRAPGRICRDVLSAPAGARASAAAVRVRPAPPRTGSLALNLAG